MDTEPYSPLQALMRQRRNLMASSLLLIFFKAAGVTFQRVGFLGTELIIERPDVLYTGLWFVWCYFLVRYIQFLLEVGNLGIVERVLRKIRDYAQKKFNAYEFQTNDGSVIHRNIRYLGNRRWALVADTYRLDRGDVVENDEHSFGLVQAAVWAIRATCSTAISSTKITEYLLPLLLALVTAIVGAWYWLQPGPQPL